jgi:hypothetical protein
MRQVSYNSRFASNLIPEEKMRRSLFAIGLLLLTFCFRDWDAVAQTAAPPHTTPGSVTRITLVRIKPGRADDFWTDVRQNLKPIYEAYKAAGIIENYGFATKSTTDGEDDWNVAISLSYKNWAALDDLGPKQDPITLKHYGSAAARTAAAQKRLENGIAVSSFLIRQQKVNDIPK